MRAILSGCFGGEAAALSKDSRLLSHVAEARAPSPIFTLASAFVDGVYSASVLRTVTPSSIEATLKNHPRPGSVIVFENDPAAQECSADEQPSTSGRAQSAQFNFKVRCAWTNGASGRQLGGDATRNSGCARQQVGDKISSSMAARRVLCGLLKGIAGGQCKAVRTWDMCYGGGATNDAALLFQPCVWREDDGTCYIASVILAEAQTQSQLSQDMTRDHLCLKHLPYSMITTTNEGYICSQNVAAMALFGCLPTCSEDLSSEQRGINFLEMLFFGHEDLYQNMLSELQQCEEFEFRIRLLSPELLRCLGVEDGEEVWHRLHISSLGRPTSSSAAAFVITQSDITDVVLGERCVMQLQVQQRSLLKEILPLEVIEAILLNKSKADGQQQNQGSGKCSSDGMRSSDAGSNRSSLDRKASPVLEPDDVDPPEDPYNIATLRTMRQTAPAGSVDAAMGLVQRFGSFRVPPSSSSLRFQRALLSRATTRQQPSHLVSHPDLLGGLRCTPGGTGLQDATGRIWLTQQDVMDLATCHDAVTILFADIKGFTSLSQELHPAQVMLFLNQLYSVWDEMLDTYGVYKVETIGDCYMVAGGLFSDDANGDHKLGGHDPMHAAKVLGFARAMLESSSLLLDPLGHPVEIRVGMHSGPCVSGIVGQRMPRFCCFGDTINTASRLESTCPRAGIIHVSESTRTLLPNEPWKPTGGVYCKGKGTIQSYIIDPAEDCSSGAPFGSASGSPVCPDLTQEAVVPMAGSPSPLQAAPQELQQESSGIHLAHAQLLDTPSSSLVSSTLYGGRGAVAWAASGGNNALRARQEAAVTAFGLRTNFRPSVASLVTDFRPTILLGSQESQPTASGSCPEAGGASESRPEAGSAGGADMQKDQSDDLLLSSDDIGLLLDSGDDSGAGAAAPAPDTPPTFTLPQDAHQGRPSVKSLSAPLLHVKPPKCPKDDFQFLATPTDPSQSQCWSYRNSLDSPRECLSESRNSQDSPRECFPENRNSLDSLPEGAVAAGSEDQASGGLSGRSIRPAGLPWSQLRLSVSGKEVGMAASAASALLSMSGDRPAGNSPAKASWAAGGVSPGGSSSHSGGSSSKVTKRARQVLQQLYQSRPASDGSAHNAASPELIQSPHFGLGPTSPKGGHSSRLQVLSPSSPDGGHLGGHSTHTRSLGSAGMLIGGFREGGGVMQQSPTGQSPVLSPPSVRLGPGALVFGPSSLELQQHVEALLHPPGGGCHGLMRRAPSAGGRVAGSADSKRRLSAQSGGGFGDMTPGHDDRWTCPHGRGSVG